MYCEAKLRTVEKYKFDGHSEIKFFQHFVCAMYVCVLCKCAIIHRRLQFGQTLSTFSTIRFTSLYRESTKKKIA